MERKLTRKVKVGNKFVGGDALVTIQSMTNTDTRDAKKTLEQINSLYKAGCDII
ncbi:MAG: flavodoxin-dependent (E)-4-hydroxy-3-methylbut-2-enyl-diphosphate synthase, partial [Clostridium sp.]